MNPDDLAVKEIMTKDVISVAPDEPVSKALSKMQEYGFHELPVVDEKGNLVGFVNYKALIRRKSLSLFSRVDSVMVKPPTVDPEDSVVSAVKKMIDAGFRSLPVVKKEKVIGIISRTDVLRIVPKLKEVADIPVEDVFSSEPAVVSEDDPVERAIDVMKSISELSIPVVDKNNHLVGIVHMRDVARALWRVKDRASQGELAGEKEKKVVYVKEIVGPAVYTKLDAKLGEAVDKMIKFKSSICAVVEEDMRPIGVISQRDVMEAIIRKGKTEGVFVQITGLDVEDPEPYMVIYDMVEAFLKKINRLKEFKPQLLTFHVEVHHITGEETKYSVRARLTTDRKLFFAKSYDWNMYRAFKDVLETLERNVKKEREKLIEFRKVTL